MNQTIHPLKTVLLAIALAKLSANAEITIVNQVEGFLGSTKTQVTTAHNGTTQVSYDATGVSKLVVAIGTESGNNNQKVNTIGVKFNNVGMTLAAWDNTIFDSSPPLPGDNDGGVAAIFYLDNPYQGTSTFSVSVTTTSGSPNGGHVSIIGLAGTEAGVGNTNASWHTLATPGNVSTSLTTATNNSLVIAMVENSGINNSAGTPTVVAPLVPSNNGSWGSQWGGAASGYQFVGPPGSILTPTFSTNAGGNIHVVAAEFTAPSFDIPTNPSPAYGLIVPGGTVNLSWTNLSPNTGSDVWVDVWFGTDPEALVRVVDASTDSPNRDSTSVTAPLGDNYYWRVDTYRDGASSGTPVTGTVFHFMVEDGDNDGLPDTYEFQYTGSPTAMNPGDDLENGGAGDGLTNIEEYNLGTSPTNPDSDGDTLMDGPELSGVGLRPPTDPKKSDTDGDGINDGAESNTGTWVGTSDTGTNPVDTDSDDDGLADGVETNSGTLTGLSDTGTSPVDSDSDNDGAGDWYEVAIIEENPAIDPWPNSPNDPDLKPNIPYPLPAPESTPPATNKPVKVYVLSGQSNMVGQARISGAQPGTLETITGTEGKFPHLVASGGGWTERNDVYYRGVIATIGNAPLAPGATGSTTTFGPELGFGHVMGYKHDEPVLVLKSSQGGRAIGWDFLPPGSVQYTSGSKTYAGYGDSPASWTTGTTPTPTAFYGGYQYDQCFLDEADWSPTSTSAPLTNAADVLDNFATEYAGEAQPFEGMDFEIAGFVWWQGWNDGLSYTTQYADRYEQNMAQFIRKIRQYYHARYPGKIAEKAPFVIATCGFQGWNNPYATRAKVVQAQLNVANPLLYPEFAGNVKTIETRNMWRAVADSPQSDESHYNRNAETYLLVGEALGRAMIELESPITTDDYADWATNYPGSDLTDSNADLDGDGLTNNEERIWGLDPTSGGSVNPIKVPLDATAGTLVYTRRNQALTGLNFTYQWSETLASESWTDFTPAAEVSDSGNPIEEVTITLGAELLAKPKLFVRVLAAP